MAEFDALDAELRSLHIAKDRKIALDYQSRSPWRYAAYTVLVVTLSVGSWVGWQRFAGAQPIAVEVAQIQPAPLGAPNGSAPSGPALAPVLTAGGYVIPHHKIQLSSKVTSRVAAIRVNKGDQVQQGQLLVKLEDTEFRAQVEEARGNLHVTQARLQELTTGSRPQEVEQARANVALVEANVRNAQVSYERAAQLVTRGLLAQGDYDKALTTYEVAQAQLIDARKRYELVKLGPRREHIALARGQVEAAQAAYARAATLLDATEIRAPIAGTVLEKLVETGEVVTTSFVGERGAKSAVISLADLNDLQVELDISQADFHKLHVGQKATVVPESYTERTYEGLLVEIAPEANRQKATVQVKVKILTPDKYLLPEMNAKVTFLGETSNAALSATQRLILPRAAVIRHGSTTHVLLAQNSHAVAQVVKLGSETQEGFTVLEGLYGGEQVIISDVHNIKPGEPIHIK